MNTTRRDRRNWLSLLLLVALAALTLLGPSAPAHAQDPGPDPVVPPPGERPQGVTHPYYGIEAEQIENPAPAEGVGAAVRLVTEGLSIVLAIVSVYLTVGIGTAFVEGQFAAMTDSPGARAEIMYRISLLVMCVAVIAFSHLISADVVAILGGGITDFANFRAAMLRIGMYFVDIVIGIAVVLMAVGVAFGFVDTQLQTVLGQPVGLSTALSRITAVLILGIGALMTVAIARAIIMALGGG